MTTEQLLKPYQRVIWEPLAYREPGATEKKLLTDDESLERLQKVGFDRHPRSAEVYSLLIARLRGELPSGLEPIAENMLEDWGEHLGMQWQRRGKSLIAGLEQGGSPMKYAEKTFPIGDLPSEEYIPLREVPKDLTVFLYSKPLDQIPKEMRDRAGIYLPPEGVIYPVGRGGFGNWFDVGFGIDIFGVVFGASRGVRRANAEGVV